MNPLLGKGGYGIGDVIKLYKQAKNNPSMISNLLYQNGRIDQTQMQAMQGMNPHQMAAYMSQNGIMGQQFLQSGMQYTDPIKQNLSQ